MNLTSLIKKLSVPLDYIPDSMTNGPVLPDGWDGDAWQARDNEAGYFLRAWNNETGAFAVAHSERSFNDARKALIAKIKKGGDLIVKAKRRQ